jgi:hypothetical protein
MCGMRGRYYYLSYGWRKLLIGSSAHLPNPFPNPTVHIYQVTTVALGDFLYRYRYRI